jgi:hypothetical protein
VGLLNLRCSLAPFFAEQAAVLHVAAEQAFPVFADAVVVAAADVVRFAAADVVRFAAAAAVVSVDHVAVAVAGVVGHSADHSADAVDRSADVGGFAPHFFAAVVPVAAAVVFVDHVAVADHSADVPAHLVVSVDQSAVAGGSAPRFFAVPVAGVVDHFVDVVDHSVVSADLPGLGLKCPELHYPVRSEVFPSGCLCHWTYYKFHHSTCCKFLHLTGYLSSHRHGYQYSYHDYLRFLVLHYDYHYRDSAVDCRCLSCYLKSGSCLVYLSG